MAGCTLLHKSGQFAVPKQTGSDQNPDCFVKENLNVHASTRQLALMHKTEQHDMY